VWVEYSYIDLPEALTEVLPHTVHDPVVEKKTEEFMSEDRREGRSIVYESYIGGALPVVEVVLDNREEGIDGIMGIAAWPHP
jgi:homoserine dehydrogenase